MYRSSRVVRWCSTFQAGSLCLLKKSVNAHQKSRQAVARAFFNKIARKQGLPYEYAPGETAFPVDELIAECDLPKDASAAEQKYAWETMWQKFEKAWRVQ